MTEKVIKSMKVSASGILSIDDEDIMIEVEDVGTFSLKKLFNNFDGYKVKLSCADALGKIGDKLGVFEKKNYLCRVK